MTTQPPHLTNWQPPQNYQVMPSGVEGITVWGPRPEAAPSETPVTYVCPQCGASTKYDVAAGGIACEYCGYTVPTKVVQVGKRAQASEFTLEALNQAEKGWGVIRRELHCENCGAALAIPEGDITATCPFCSSNKVNVSTPSLDLLRPRFLIPFKIEPAATRTRATEWLGKGWFHPKELATSAVIDRFMGIYLPFWTFSAYITADWKAEVGHTQMVRTGKTTQTRIVWRWENGQVKLPIDNLLVSGSSHVSRVILEKLNPFNMSDLVAYTADFLAGWQAHAYDIPLTTAWEKGKETMRERAKKDCYENIHSSHVRNFSMNADFANETWRYILLPVYIASYKFEDKTYQVMVNGQTGLVAGQKPVAWWKIWLAIAILLLPGLLVGLVGFPLKSLAGTGNTYLIIGFILLVIGGILSAKLFTQAVGSEAA